jgi:hypothetical protein
MDDDVRVGSESELILDLQAAGTQVDASDGISYHTGPTSPNLALTLPQMATRMNPFPPQLPQQAVGNVEKVIMHKSALDISEEDEEHDFAETLADPYKGKTPLPIVPSYREPFASCHVIQQKSPNTWSGRTNQYLEPSLETHRIHSFPPIATE